VTSLGYSVYMGAPCAFNDILINYKIIIIIIIMEIINYFVSCKRGEEDERRNLDGSITILESTS
jgi:hypothetical protein